MRRIDFCKNSKISNFIIIAFALMILTSCGDGGGDGSSSLGSGSSLVTITVGGGGQTASLKIQKNTLLAWAIRHINDLVRPNAAIAAIPAEVATIAFTISASDIETIRKDVPVLGQTSITETFTVPNGSDRFFLVEAKDAGGVLYYSGSTYADLNGGTVTLNIIMAAILPVGSMVGGVTVIAASSSQIDISWTPATYPGYITSYVIYRNGASLGYTTTNSTFSDTGLSPATNYCYSVTAHNSVGESARTSELCATTLSATPSGGEGIIYVTNSGAPGAILSFNNARNVNGNTAPSRSITGGNTTLATPYHLGVDTTRNVLYTSNSNTVLRFNNPDTATGNIAPDAILGTGVFGGTGGISVDAARNRLYAVDIDNHQIARFDNASQATGATAPTLFTTPASSLHHLNVPYGVTLDIPGNTIFVANNGSHEILVWDGASSLIGGVEPDRFIQEPTGCMSPDGLYYDNANNELWVAGQDGVIYVFGSARAANGVLAPTRTITSGSWTQPTDVYYDSAGDTLYMVDRNGGNSQILVFNNARSINGAATPDRSITGASTTLNESTGITLDLTR